STYAATCVTSSHAMSFFFFISLQASSTSEIYTLSLHDALPIFAKSLVGFERIDGLGARGRYTLAAGHLQLDFAGDEHDGEDVTGGIRRPTEGWFLEGFQQALAIRRAAGVDEILDAGNGLVVGLETGLSSRDLYQAEGIELAGNGGRVG